MPGSGNGISIDPIPEDLTRIFRTVGGTGPPGETLQIQLQTGWGDLDPMIGTPLHRSRGGGWEAPWVDQGEHYWTVQVGADGRWSVDLDEVADGSYWVVAGDEEAILPVATAPLKVWASPTARFEQRLARDPSLVGPPASVEAPSSELRPPREFTVNDPEQEASQSFRAVSGTGRPGDTLNVEVYVTESGVPDRSPITGRLASGEHTASHTFTVGEDGAWSVDLGELPDGEYRVEVNDNVDTWSQTIQVWTAPWIRLEQREAHGIDEPVSDPRCNGSDPMARSSERTRSNSARNGTKRACGRSRSHNLSSGPQARSAPG